MAIRRSAFWRFLFQNCKNDEGVGVCVGYCLVAAQTSNKRANLAIDPCLFGIDCRCWNGAARIGHRRDHGTEHKVDFVRSGSSGYGLHDEGIEGLGHDSEVVFCSISG